MKRFFFFCILIFTLFSLASCKGTVAAPENNSIQDNGFLAELRDKLTEEASETDEGSNEILTFEENTRSDTENTVPDRAIGNGNVQTVYITPTGKRYHFSEKCGGKSSFSVTFDEALSRGLTPCKKCAE